jgi:hypothetical protein
LADIEAEFIHYSFHLVLELAGVTFAEEIVFEYWVREDFIP